jgi:hypothetical protein
MSRYNRREDIEEPEATFNDALNMVERINKLLEDIIDSKKSPNIMHPLYNTFFFQLRISYLDCFWREIGSFCNEEERGRVNILFKAIPIAAKNLFIRRNDVMEFNWKTYDLVFNPFLNKIETELRDLQFKYGLGNPLKDREYGL